MSLVSGIFINFTLWVYSKIVCLCNSYIVGWGELLGDVIGISFERMDQAKIKLTRARDLSQQVINNFNAAITVLENGTSLKVRLAAADIKEQVNKVSRRIEDIDRVNVGINLVVKRFQEVDDDIVRRVKGVVEEYTKQNNQLTLGESTVNVSALGSFQFSNSINMLEMNDYEKLQDKVTETDSANNWLSNDASYAWGGIKSGIDAVVSFTGTTVGQTFNNFIYKPIYATGKAAGYIQNELTGSNDINNSNEYFKKNNIDVTVDWFDSLGSNKTAKDYGNITGTGAGQILQMISLGAGGKALGIASKAAPLVQNGILNFGSGAISTALNQAADGKSGKEILNNAAKIGLITSLTGIGFESIPYVTKGISNVFSKFNDIGLKPAFATSYASPANGFNVFNKVGPLKKPSIYGGAAANIEFASKDVGSSVVKGNVSKVEYGSQYTKVNGKKALKPNVEYITNDGYKYSTDADAHISNVEGSLEAGKVKRNIYAQRTVGKDNGRLSTDDGGHLIASIFKGSGDLDNLVPMDATLNRGNWKSMETTWAKALEKNKIVDVQIQPLYKGISQRPISFKVKYRIDGDEWIKKQYDN